MTPLLKPFELLYRGLNRLRRILFRAGVLRAKRLPRPVICVGNIAVGGTGKTPLTIAIARMLTADGLRVVVLSRGYKRQSTSQSEIVASRDAARFGDEPVLIAEAVPEATVVVGAQRYEAAMHYLKDHDCDVFLLDDGFQHLQLARDLDVVIDDPDAKWLREGRSALRDAGVVVSRGEGEFRATLQSIFVRRDGSQLPAESLRGARVTAFSAIANNERFVESLRSLGATVVEEHSFPDHHSYLPSDLDRLRRSAAATATTLITTGKDAVKIKHDGISVLEVEMRVEPADLFRRRIEDAIAGANQRR